MHAFINELERPIGTYLYGRRMYEVMVGWESAHTVANQPQVSRDFALIWQAAYKIVYSKTLSQVSSARTRIEGEFEPGAVAKLKAESSSDLTVGGPNLAAQAIHAGLVDEYHLFVCPVVVGGGSRALPRADRLELELIAQRRFENGMVYLSYRTRP